MIDEKQLIELLEEEILRIDTESTPGCGNLYGRDASVMKNTLNFVIDLINEQPKVNGWIPVEERLPDKEGDCYGINIVTLESGEVCIGVYRNDDKLWYTRLFEGETLYNNKRNVIAWGPLPEPFKGD